MRHGIDHPVVNDAEFQIWSRYSVRAWPTVVVVDPAGKVVAYEAGEIEPARFTPVVDAMIAEFDARGALDRSPIPGLRAETTGQGETQLRYPSKVLATSGGRLFISDTGHHHVLEVNLHTDGRSGEIVRIFGTGEPGLTDGAAESASFYGPHGLAFQQTESGSTLYVADTENHAVRAIDLVRQQVRTVAGTGRFGRSIRGEGADAPATDLRSPWALVSHQHALFIAMAGSHQVWLLLDEETLGLFAGTGAEALVDGPRAEAAFNQPSDLVLEAGHLFVADAEAGAIRAVTLDDQPRVMTIVGQGLFEFGDVDGFGAEVRLQHPTGLASDGRLLYIADSYNHKIKTLDPNNREVHTLIGSGTAGAADGSFEEAQLYEPEGISAAGGLLYIADTNNHAVRVADLAAREIVTLALT